MLPSDKDLEALEALCLDLTPSTYSSSPWSPNVRWDEVRETIEKFKQLAKESDKPVLLTAYERPFKITTVTGRLSSNQPNMQNFPKTRRPIEPSVYEQLAALADEED